MPTNGKYAPQPERYGGLGTQRAPTIKILADALGKSRGTAYDSSQGTTVEVENWGLARALWESWETNRRLSFVADPFRMTGTVLARWERMLCIAPEPTATEPERRETVQERFGRFGMLADHQEIRDRLAASLGPVFVDLFHVTLAEAVVWWPGGTPNVDAPWYSTVCHVVVKTQKPAGYSEADYMAAIALVNDILDPILPAHMTWDWYRNGDGHTGAWATDTGAGFFLDDDRNLDFEILDA